jgi:hypothetical protein
MSGIKGRKELGLRNVGYRASDQMLYFSAISLLKQAKAPDIERLKQMRRMRRHTKRDDLVFLAIPLKGDRVVTFVAIED